eukprot:TRINITY_DN4331_c0_g1_i1.p1 TRINITY_DN4331_c0_g1~~TRINITY_DN4331_c0_g1_i1.p1  ORF type:complete len:387 (-),score=38.05 TRINITY_DN4331_c0_g1_i1:137-1198(-)
MADNGRPLIYQCDQCERSFSVQSNLRRHIRTVHSDNRPFVCQVCGKTFNQNCNLKRHLRIHTAEERGLLSTSSGSDFVITSSESSPKRSIDSMSPPPSCNVSSEEFAPSAAPAVSALDATALMASLNMFHMTNNAILLGNGGPELDELLYNGQESSCLQQFAVQEEDEILGNGGGNDQDVFIEILPTLSVTTGKFGIHSESMGSINSHSSGGRSHSSGSGKFMVGVNQFIGVNPSSNELQGLDRLSRDYECADVLFNPVIRVSGEVIATSGASSNSNGGGGVAGAMRSLSDHIPLFNISGRNSSAELQVFRVSGNTPTGNQLTVGLDIGFNLHGSASYVESFVVQRRSSLLMQ